MNHTDKARKLTLADAKRTQVESLFRPVNGRTLTLAEAAAVCVRRASDAGVSVSANLKAAAK